MHDGISRLPQPHRIRDFSIYPKSFSRLVSLYKVLSTLYGMRLMDPNINIPYYSHYVVPSISSAGTHTGPWLVIADVMTNSVSLVQTTDSQQ